MEMNFSSWNTTKGEYDLGMRGNFHNKLSSMAFESETFMLRHQDSPKGTLY